MRGKEKKSYRALPEVLGGADNSGLIAVHEKKKVKGWNMTNKLEITLYRWFPIWGFIIPMVSINELPQYIRSVPGLLTRQLNTKSWHCLNRIKITGWKEKTSTEYPDLFSATKREKENGNV